MVVNNSTDLSTLNFDDELVFEFDSIDDLLSKLDSILSIEESAYDIKNLQGPTFKLNFKNQSVSNLIDIFSFAMDREKMVNTRMILNLQVFINGYSTFDDSLFESPEIFISKIENVLDIKLALIDKLKAFNTQIAYWFLACLKSMHKVEYTAIDPVVTLPPLFKRILFSSNLLNLSSIIQKANNIQTKDLPLVEDSFPVVMELATNSALANNMIQSFNFESFMQTNDRPE